LNKQIDSREILRSEIGTAFLHENMPIVFDRMKYIVLVISEFRNMFFQEFYSQSENFLRGLGEEFIEELDLGREKTMNVLVPLIRKLEDFFLICIGVL